MSAFAPTLSAGPSTMTPMKWGLVAGLMAMGALWGAFVAFQGLSAALVCLAAIVFVFTIRDFRVGVLVMILIMPISSSYMFPRAMFGVTGNTMLESVGNVPGAFSSAAQIASGLVAGYCRAWWPLPLRPLPRWTWAWQSRQLGCWSRRRPPTRRRTAC